MLLDKDAKRIPSVRPEIAAIVDPCDNWLLIEEREEEETAGGLILPVGADASIRLVVQKCGPEVKNQDTLLGAEVLIHPKAEILSVEHVTGMRKRFLVRDHSVAALVRRGK